MLLENFIWYVLVYVYFIDLCIFFGVKYGIGYDFNFLISGYNYNG